jgi:hypothetical protein
LVEVACADCLAMPRRRLAANDAAVVGGHAAGEADFIQAYCRAGEPPAARRAMIVLDASVVVEPLTNGALAESIRSELSVAMSPS